MLDSIRARMGTLVFEGKVSHSLDMTFHASNMNTHSQKYLLTEKDIENLGRIGNGITGEVFKIRHKPTNKVMAAKVSKQSLSLHTHLHYLMSAIAD